MVEIDRRIGIAPELKKGDRLRPTAALTANNYIAFETRRLIFFKRRTRDEKEKFKAGDFSPIKYLPGKYTYRQ